MIENRNYQTIQQLIQGKEGTQLRSSTQEGGFIVQCYTKEKYFAYVM